MQPQPSIFLLWAALHDPPYSVLIGAFATREAAEAADENSTALGEARHLLHPDRLAPRSFPGAPSPRTISELTLHGEHHGMRVFREEDVRPLWDEVRAKAEAGARDGLERLARASAKVALDAFPAPEEWKR